MIAAQEQQFDAAILDVNLDGATVYRLAHLLAERDIPFAFVTGYDPATIDAKFHGVPVLQKPVGRDTLNELLVQIGPHLESHGPARDAAAYGLRRRSVG
jgi:CheY-like chemotaxis protein